MRSLYDECGPNFWKQNIWNCLLIEHWSRIESGFIGWRSTGASGLNSSGVKFRVIVFSNFIREQHFLFGNCLGNRVVANLKFSGDSSHLCPVCTHIHVDFQTETLKFDKCCLGSNCMSEIVHEQFWGSNFFLNRMWKHWSILFELNNWYSRRRDSDISSSKLKMHKTKQLTVKTLGTWKNCIYLSPVPEWESFSVSPYKS